MAPFKYLRLVIAVLAFGVSVSSQVSLDSSENIESDVSRRKLTAVKGYWSTNGTKIVTSDGTEVFFSGVNFGGFEAAECRADVLFNPRPLKDYMVQMIKLGFNLIRIPFSSNCVQPGVLPGFIDLTANPTLEGLTSLEVLQEVVAAAGSAGIRVILDYHRINSTDPVTGAPEHGLWYNETYPTEYFLNTWKNVTLALRDYPAVVGVDLFNEPYGAIWDMSDNPKNWRNAAKRAADVIQTLMPDWLICIEGLFRDSNWGGNLQDLIKYPITLKVPKKLVYTVHEYGPLVANNTWLTAGNFPLNLDDHWDTTYGFVKKQGIAPLWIGEFGTRVDLASTGTYESIEKQWFYKFKTYISDNNLVWTYWQWGPNSFDTGGILTEDWLTIHDYKIDLLRPIMYPQFKLNSGPIQQTPSGGSYYAPPPSPTPGPIPNSALRSFGGVSIWTFLGALLLLNWFVGW